MGRSTYRHLVTLLAPGPAGADDDGQASAGPPVPLTPPTWYCAIRPVSALEERQAAQPGGVTVTVGTHVVEGDYRPDITTGTLIDFEGRRLFVHGVTDPDERHITVILQARELPAAPRVEAHR